MFMCKEVVLAVFVIAVALGAEPEFQIISVILGPSADGTLMLGNPCRSPYLTLEVLPSVDLGG